MNGPDFFTKAQQMLANPANTEHDAMQRVIAAESLLELALALIEQAHAAKQLAALPT